MERRNMATAKLINPVTVDGGTAYEVDTYPFNQRPLMNADGRRWAAFKVVRGQGARYEWQTGADAVREAATKVTSGASTLARAMKDPFVLEWVGRRREEFIEAIQDDEPGVVDLVPAQLVRRMLLERGQRLTNRAGPLGYYDEENPERYLRDAAQALDLPRWASVRLSEDGGPGTGFTAVSIWVRSGHTLADLATWLTERPEAAR
jgi:hypothetical protein